MDKPYEKIPLGKYGPRPGTETVKIFDEHEPIVAMLEYRGNLYIATARGLYRKEMGEDTLRALTFEVIRDG